MTGDEWALSVVIAVSVLLLVAIIRAIRADLRPSRPGGCSASSGLLMGYKCGLGAGHDGKHEAIVGETFEVRYGKRVKIGESKMSW